MPVSPCTRLFPLKPLTLAFLVGLSGPSGALVGDSGKQQAGKFYESALSYFAAEDYDGAIIELKNALQQDSKMLPALVLLGRAQLELGHGEAAETFLKEAVANGADASLTAVPLAKARLLQFKHDDVLGAPVPGQLPPTVLAELLLVRARAALETSNREVFETMLRDVERIDPQNEQLLTMRTAAAIQDGNLELARTLAADALARYPESSFSWLSQASLLHTEGKLEEALAAYGEVLERDADSAEARLARIGLLLDLKRDAESDADFENLAKSRPDDPRVTYLKAVKLSRAGDGEGSRLALARANAILGALGPNVVNRNPQLLLVSGISAFSLKSYESARTALTQYVMLAPNEFGPRRVLATVLLEQRDFRDAVKVLEDTIERFGDHPEILTMLGSAYEGVGKNNRAEAVLKRAAELRAGDAAAATRLALNRLRSGETGRAMADLAEIFVRHDASATAGLPLAVMHLQQRQYDQAAEVATKLLEQQPENVEYLNVMAIADVGRQRYAEARAAFEKILARVPENKGAQLNLAKLDVREQHYDAARERLKSLLGREPNDAQLMLELGRVAAASGNGNDALRWGAEANRAAPDSFDAASFLVDAYLAAGKQKEAVDLALEQGTRHRDNLYVMNRQVDVLRQVGDRERARLILKQMSARAQADASWLTTIARQHLRNNDLTDAGYVLEKAAQIDAANTEAQILLAEVELAKGDLDAAQTRSMQLSEALPQSDAGPRIFGHVLMRRGDFGGAAEQFQRALQLNDGLGVNAVNLHVALVSAGRRDEALVGLERYVEAHPDSPDASLALAEFHLRSGDLTAAHRAFQLPLKLLPDNPQLLNNYANLLFAMNDPGAVNVARRAYERAPTSAAVSDTLGWLLVNAGNTEEGLPLLRDARTRDSGNPEIQYHLAVALDKLGRRAEAKSELEALLGREGDFEQREAAERLLQRLNG